MRNVLVRRDLYFLFPCRDSIDFFKVAIKAAAKTLNETFDSFNLITLRKYPPKILRHSLAKLLMKL